jgi:protease-4
MTKENRILIGIGALFLVSIITAVLLQHPKETPKESPGVFSSKGFVGSNKNQIALVHLYGQLTTSGRSGFYESTNGSDQIIEKLNNLEENDNLKAVILRINSPGGTVGSSQELYNALVSFKKKKNIPIIASIADMGTSGAYWAALASDTIYANPGSMVGSIGVFMGNYDLSGLSEKFGIGFTIVKGGKYKDTLSQWKKPSKDELKILETLINDVHTQFIDAVAQSRNMSFDDAKVLADGRIYTGNQALSAKLIDKTGGLQDAISFAKESTKMDDEPVIIDTRKEFFQPWMQYFRKRFEGLAFLSRFL